MILRTLLPVILPATVAAADAPVKSLLERIEAGSLDLAPLAVSYDDLHPLHGGLVLTIHGTGKVEQRAVRQSYRIRRTAEISSMTGGSPPPP